MAQIFHPSLNNIARASILGAIFIIAAVSWVWAEINRSPYMTQVHVIRDQPAPFSHLHHVKGLGLDCRFCHTSVEDSSFAGMPATKVCMTCHSQIFTSAEMLAPVRESWRTGQPLQWTRVHDLPDYVYFDHSIHVQKGVGCQTCHGQVNEMPLMWKENTLQMRWCLNCHRNPEEFVRPRDQVLSMDYAYPDDRRAEGLKLLDRYHIDTHCNDNPHDGPDGERMLITPNPLTNCSTCHR